jgi:hypothetical protein
MDAWLDRLRKEIEETTSGIRESDWSLAPSGRWNSAQIMEHLGRTYGTTAKMLELSMGAGGSPQVRTARVQEFLTKLLIVHLGNLSFRGQISCHGGAAGRSRTACAEARVE